MHGPRFAFLAWGVRRLIQIARRGQSLPKGGVVRHGKIGPPMTLWVKLRHGADVCCKTAFPPKAEVRPRSCYVENVTKPAVSNRSKAALIRSPRRRGRAAWAARRARARGRQIDDEIELGRLYHRQIGGLLAFQDATGIDTNLAIGFGDAGPVAHQAAGFGVPA